MPFQPYRYSGSLRSVMGRSGPPGPRGPGGPPGQDGDAVVDLTDYSTTAQTAQQLAAKADLVTVNGVPQIPTSQMPSVTISDTFPVASQAAMLALTAQRGDFALRTDFTPARVWLLKADPATTLANWQDLGAVSGGSGTVTTVNGQGGPTVVLGKADVGLDQANNTSDANKPISTATATALGGKVSTTTGAKVEIVTVLPANDPAKVGTIYVVRA